MLLQVRDRLAEAERLLAARGCRAAPWYVALGPGDAGTTTWLRAAGARGRWTGGGGLSAGTAAPLELLVSDGALVADIAGPLVTQDLDREVQSAVWTGLLRRLRRAAAGRIAGVLVFVEAPCLLGAQDEVNALAARLDEVRAVCGALPLYLIVTKLDRLPGFGAFFAGLDGDAAERPCGGLLPPGESRPSALGPLLDSLSARLGTQTIFRLQAVGAGAQGAEAFGFPAAFGRLRDPLLQLANRLLPGNAQGLRGLFFSASPAAGSGRARVAFARDVLGGVVVPEAGLARRGRRGLPALALAAAAAALLLFAGGASALLADYRNQVTTLARIDAAAGRAAQHLDMTSVNVVSGYDPRPVLPVLDELADVAGGADAGPSLLLFDRAARAAAAARAAYREALARLLAPRLRLAVEAALGDQGTAPAVLDDTALRDWLDAGGWPVAPEDAAALRRHVGALLARVAAR